MKADPAAYLRILHAARCSVWQGPQPGLITAKGPPSIINDECFRETTLAWKPALLALLLRE